jgi:hypothetical protein
LAELERFYRAHRALLITKAFLIKALPVDTSKLALLVDTNTNEPAISVEANELAIPVDINERN